MNFLLGWVKKFAIFLVHNFCSSEWLSWGHKDDKPCWTVRCPAHRICLFGLEHNLGNQKKIFFAWPCLIREVLVTSAKFLGSSGCCAVIISLFFFWGGGPWHYGLVQNYIKHKFLNLTKLHIYLYIF